MRLESGTRLGPYQIVGAIGAGGMGQVYRARDPRLGREVAIKIIGADAEPTAEQRERFQREARAVAGLAHPHIGSLFDVGHEQGTDYLVIELLEGETLAARLERGPLPLEQCLHVGASIASALAAAHARGIVHRDLKPANVILTALGPKLVDFGLAKAFGAGSPLSDESPESARLTRTGMVVGTVPYMAPEQIEGTATDARTDIFAFGALLYEMVTGRPAFSAPTPVALVGAVLASDPPSASSIRAGTPPALDRLIHTCLAKDPAERWHSARDVELQIRSITDQPREPSPQARGRAAAWLPWAITAGALVLAGYSLTQSRRSAPPATEVRFTIDPPAGGGFAWNSETNAIAVSPDGRTIAFIAFDSTGEQQVWLRSLGATVSTPLRGSSDAQSVMWAPDGSAIAFFTRDRLVRVDLPDGSPVTLTQITTRTGLTGSWGEDGWIAYSGVQGEAIYRVRASGGSPEILTAPDTTAGETRTQFPWHLPDGRGLLYTAREKDGTILLKHVGADGRVRPLTDVQSLAQYGKGHLVFVRDGTLLGQAWDARTGQLGGEPLAIAGQVRHFLSTGAAVVSVSNGGTLAYQVGADHQDLVWLDRTGRQIGAHVSSGSFLDATLSNDAQQVLVTRQQLRLGTWDIWLVDLEQGTEAPLTTAPLTEIFGVWLAGDRSIIYSVATGPPPNLVRRDLDSATETLLVPQPMYQSATDVSPDGRTLLYRQRPGTGNFDLWTLSLEGAPDPTVYIESPFSETEARFSPDGRYVAFIADDTGRPELYVAPFPGPGQKTRVSTDGARSVRWPRRGRELIYASLDGRMMAVAAQTAPALRLGQPVQLFANATRTPFATIEASADGQRFLVAVPVLVASRQPMMVIANWTAGR